MRPLTILVAGPVNADALVIVCCLIGEYRRSKNMVSKGLSEHVSDRPFRGQGNRTKNGRISNGSANKCSYMGRYRRSN